MAKRYFSEKVVEWYLKNKRDLPWRNTTDPYKIWLSEIILQQTRVAQGTPYYLRFVETYPTVNALANAAEEKVLRLWQGLGYYTRARNLHRCAKTVVSSFNGVFPTSFEVLKTLPGIGEYTAAAIASFCAREPVAVLDGNVYRVIARTHGIDTPINSTEGKKVFSQIAASLVPKERPDLHNQAMMEFGAMLCKPTDPDCDSCPLRKACIAYRDDLIDALPIKLKSKSPRKRYFHYFVFKKGDSLMMKKRDTKDIWNGLYDFFLVETDKAVSVDQLRQENKILKKYSSDEITSSNEYKHVLSHQTIVSTFHIIEHRTGTGMLEEPSLAYYSRRKIVNLPKPVLISRFLSDYEFL